MPNRFKYTITADDQTAKGIGSATKRMSGLTAATKGYAKAAGEARKSGPGGQGGLTAVKGALEQTKDAAASLASAAPGLSRYTSTLSQVSGAASRAAGGLAAAAESGSGLGAALGGLAAVGGGAVAVVAALGIGAFKLASGWAEGRAQIGRLSQSIGVAAGDLQRFQAVGEQYGVDQGATAGALGGVSSTVHEAIYGRNNYALAALNQLGVKISRGKDGLPDVKQITLDLSDAIARQKDPMTQARIAQIFGMTSALPLLRQGSAVIKAGMDDAGKYAAISDDADNAAGARIYREGVQAKQLAGRAGLAAEKGVALAGEPALKAGLAAGRAAADGAPGAVKGAGRAISGFVARGVDELGRAASSAAGEAKVLGGALGSLASRIEHLGERSRQDQVSPKGARGVMQVMPETARETAARHGVAYNEDRYRNDPNFSREIGTDYLSDLLGRYDGDETLAAAAYNAGPGRVDKDRTRYIKDHHGHYDEQDFVRDPHYLPAETRAYVQRVVPPSHIVLEIHGLPSGAKVTAKASPGNSVAVAQAGVGNGL